MNRNEFVIKYLMGIGLWVVLMAALIFLASNCNASPPEAWFTQKQELHFFTSYAIDATVSQMVKGSTTKKLIIANFVTLGLGYLKELADTHPSEMDFNADLAGATAYSLIHYTLEF